MKAIRATGAALLCAAAIALPAASAQAAPESVAALQTALTGLHLYTGYVDGVRGPLTRKAVIAFQRQNGLAADGVAGPKTRAALGWRGRPRLGSRTMKAGDIGWDVAALQFMLQRAGHGPGRADGAFGPLTEAAVRRAQAAAGIGVDGLAGPATINALRGGSSGAPSGSGSPSGPVRFLRPVAGPTGDGFGAPRSDHVHQGIDFPVPYGTPVGAAGVGTTIFAGYNSGGFGNLVVVQHRLGYTTWYAHLSSFSTYVGESVEGGSVIGYVGSTGNSTGPHLHFEVRHYDTPIDPAPLLLSEVSARRSTGGARGPALECRGGGDGKAHRVRRGADWIAHERLCVGRLTHSRGN